MRLAENKLKTTIAICLSLAFINLYILMNWDGLRTAITCYNSNQPKVEPVERTSSMILAPAANDLDLSFERPYVSNRRVDLRIIVLTYNRCNYLKELLNTVDELEMDGEEMAVEIWIDRNPKGEVDRLTLDASKNFSRSNNYTNVHVRKRHAGLFQQWISTYCSDHLKENETEIVLFLEDDLLISKYSYRWLKAVHEHFKDVPYFLGATLRSLQSAYPLKVDIPKNHSIFMHRIFSTHGFSPRLQVWKNFQKWFVGHYNRVNLKPYVPGSVLTSWYKQFERENRTNTMWSMWMHYYNYIEQLFTVYNNPLPPPSVTNKNDLKLSNKTNKHNSDMLCFCIDRMAKGLHFHRDLNVKCPLVEKWVESFVRFPNETIKIEWDGTRYRN